MYSFDLKIRIIQMYEKSKVSVRKLSSIFMVSKSVIHKWIHFGIYQRKRCKFKQKITQEIDNFIIIQLNTNPYTTLKDFKNNIDTQFNTFISYSAIYFFYMNFEVARNFKIHIKRIFGIILKN